jgi:hypothetical protein
VAQRLLALAAVVSWVVVPDDQLSSAELKAFVSKAGLRSALVPEEQAILDLSREDAAKEHGDTIGWRMEKHVAPRVGRRLRSSAVAFVQASPHGDHSPALARVPA